MRRQGLFYEKDRAFRRKLIEETLELHGGSRAATARALGLQRTYLYSLIRTLHVRTTWQRGGNHNPNGISNPHRRAQQ